MGPAVGKAVTGESVGSGVMTSGSLGEFVGFKESGDLLGEVVGCSVTGALFGELDGSSVIGLSVGFFDGCVV